MMPMSDTLVISPSSRAPRLETPSVSYIAGSGSTAASAQIYIPAKAELKGTVEDLEELRREYPEVVSLATKLASGMQLYKSDILILREVAEAMGWDEDDVAEELKNLATNPSERVEKYMELFQNTAKPTGCWNEETTHRRPKSCGEPQQPSSSYTPPSEGYSQPRGATASSTTTSPTTQNTDKPSATCSRRLR